VPWKRDRSITRRRWLMLAGVVAALAIAEVTAIWVWHNAEIGGRPSPQQRQQRPTRAR